uniref:Uncharacterized protein n=1 Tax=Neobodo designis TaxID=312471 RepID=A0A7S1PL73_NEODS|mmetsp:Transcript_11048/g.34178  ORF Transcript_11048/g.34178 Transcript_11048/m.34178 type:complete len:322 (+) Transcript_11048:111-1076(+)
MQESLELLHTSAPDAPCNVQRSFLQAAGVPACAACCSPIASHGDADVVSRFKRFGCGNVTRAGVEMALGAAKRATIDTKVLLSHRTEFRVAGVMASLLLWALLAVALATGHVGAVAALAAGYVLYLVEGWLSEPRRYLAHFRRQEFVDSYLKKAASATPAVVGDLAVYSPSKDGSRRVELSASIKYDVNPATVRDSTGVLAPEGYSATTPIGAARIRSFVSHSHHDEAAEYAFDRRFATWVVSHADKDREVRQRLHVPDLVPFALVVPTYGGNDCVNNLFLTGGVFWLFTVLGLSLPYRAAFYWVTAPLDVYCHKELGAAA